MEDFVKFVESIKTRVLRTNEKGKALHQTDRNQLRTDFMKALYMLLKFIGLDVELVADGIAIQLPHADLGSVVITVSGTVKELDFDIVSESEDFANSTIEKIEKAKQKALETAKNKAEADAKKAKGKATK